MRDQTQCPPASPGTSPEPEPDEFASTLDSDNVLVLDGNGPIGACTPGQGFPLGLTEAASVRDDLDALEALDPATVDADFDGVPDENGVLLARSRFAIDRGETRPRTS